jgi:hypothetical protein
MSVRSAQSVTRLFTTESSTGAATNADSLPTGTLYVNGTADAATVTVTNVTTGVYKAAVTLPTLAIGDEVELVASATIGGVAAKALVWRDAKDVALGSSGDVTVGTNNDKTGYTASTVSDKTGYSLSGTQTFNNTGTWTGGITGNVGGNVVGSVGSVSGVTFPTGFSTLTVAAIQSGLATSASQTTIAGYIDTEVAAIKAKTDQLTFTTANQVDVRLASYATGQSPDVLVLDGAMTSHIDVNSVGYYVYTGRNAADAMNTNGVSLNASQLGTLDSIPTLVGAVNDNVQLVLDDTGVLLVRRYLATGTVASTTGTTTTLDAGSVATADYYTGDVLVITAARARGKTGSSPPTPPAASPPTPRGPPTPRIPARTRCARVRVARRSRGDLSPTPKTPSSRASTTSPFSSPRAASTW